MILAAKADRIDALGRDVRAHRIYDRTRDVDSMELRVPSTCFNDTDLGRRVLGEPFAFSAWRMSLHKWYHRYLVARARPAVPAPTIR